jgi:serine/threonine protein kinase
MVTGDGLAKIVDLGIAKARTGPTSVPAGAESTMTAMAGTTPGGVVGTIGYMSPEQASGRPVDSRDPRVVERLAVVGGPKHSRVGTEFANGSGD